MGGLRLLMYELQGYLAHKKQPRWLSPTNKRAVLY
jgi:hypothetical protein